MDRYSLLEAVRYRQVDLYDAESVGRLVEQSFAGEREAALAIYLALPPSLFAPTLGALCRVSLPPGSRVAVEKPFGEDLEGARALNALLAKACDGAGEFGAFRVDHFLGLTSVQNLLGMRLANRVLEPVWNSAQIEEIEIVWEETLGLEGRAEYYDRAGQLRDMIQNHLLQVLCLLTMEPDSLRARELHDAKVALLRSVRPPDPAQMAALTRRARYTAGRSDGRDLPSYVDEAGVDSAREIETFAEVTFEIDNERWAGTRFVVRTGKALMRSRMEVVARFRQISNARPVGGTTADTPNELRIGLYEDDAIKLQLNRAVAGPPYQLTPFVLTGNPPRSALPPYSLVLLEVLAGDSALSVRGDEAEEAWRIVTPVLQAWAENRVPMLEYEAGSTGPGF